METKQPTGQKPWEDEHYSKMSRTELLQECYALDETLYKRRTEMRQSIADGTRENHRKEIDLLEDIISELRVQVRDQQASVGAYDRLIDVAKTIIKITKE